MSRKEKKREALALDEQFREVFNPLTNEKEEVSELDSRWKENIKFVSYMEIPININPETLQPSVKDQASLEEWKERALFIDQDLKYLLCLPHRDFWCQVIFDESLQVCLDSYLKLAPRMFDLMNVPLAEELQNLEQSLYKRVFMVLLRMSTHKESKDCFITPEIFGEILYNNYLFDIPKLMDICAIYGGASSNNLHLLRKMIDNIFDKQPKYYEDLNETIATLLSTFDNILTQCGLNSDEDHSPQKLKNSKQTAKHLDQKEAVDIILYLSDIAHTIKTFMETFPASCSYFLQHGLVTKLALFFEAIVPFLEEMIKLQGLKTLKGYLQHVMVSLVEVCSVMVKTCCIEPLLSSTSNRDEAQRYSEDYAQLVTSVLSEKRFLSCYDNQFSIENDLITIHSCPGSSLDGTRVQYITDAIYSAHEAYPYKAHNTRPAKDDGIVSNDVNGMLEEPGTSGIALDEREQQDKVSEAPAASISRHDVDPIKLASMVTSVRDLLPDLGEGFVVMCLEEYNYDIETVINSLLENKLPDSLDKLDRNMTKAEAISSRNEAKTLISTRHSVFDKDEFDVFTKGTNIDLSRVHKGKKRDVSTFQTLLADKDHVTDSMRERYNRYDVFGQLEKPDDYDEYDDEYDDTYDSLDVGAQDDDSADELTTRRPFTVPRILKKPNEPSPSESEDETIADEEQNEDKVTEPQTTWRTPDKRPGNKGYYTEGYNNKGRGQQQRNTNTPTQPKGDSKGKSKGKVPADPATLKQRANKEKHKAQRANHNRKAGADWKRSRGMGALPK